MKLVAVIIARLPSVETNPCINRTKPTLPTIPWKAECTQHTHEPFKPDCQYASWLDKTLETKLHSSSDTPSTLKQDCHGSAVSMMS